MEFKGTKGEMKAEGMIIKCDNIIVGFTAIMNDEHLDERLEGESWLDMRDRTELERKNLNETIPFANAKLFASSSEMLNALQEVQKHLTAHTPEYVIDLVNEAINKALSYENSRII